METSAKSSHPQHCEHFKWIDDLPSHAAQSVVKDMIKALQNMLRERKKRASGAGAVERHRPPRVRGEAGME